MAINIFNTASKKLSIYSDFRMDFAPNPLTSDLAVKRDEEAVKEALRNLLLTDRGERLFQPEIGSDIRKSLFDLMTPATIKMIEQNVKSTINNYEPRVTVTNVLVTSDYDTYSVSIEITFYVSNVQTPITVTVFLERIR